MIVVDTNIVCHLLLEREKPSQAQTLFATDNDWVSPTSWRHEFSNVLANYARHGDVELAALKTAWYRGDEYFQSAVRQEEMISALQLAVRHDVSANDAQFTALAEALAVPLIAEDKRLRDRCPERVLSMTEHIEK